MAQGDLTLFDEFSLEVLSGTHNLAAAGNDIRVSLHSTALPLASASAPSYGDWTEVTGTGYAATGELISVSQSVTNVSGATYKWDSDYNPSWTQNGAGPTDIIFALIYNDTDAGNLAIGFIDMTTDSGTTPISLQAGNVSITWNASGILTLG
jgi:hypothetical protein